MRPYPGHRKKLDHPQTRASNGEAIDTAMLTLIEDLWSHGFTTVQCCQDWAAVYDCGCYTCEASGVKPAQAYIQFGSTADTKRFVLLAEIPIRLGPDATFVTFPIDAIPYLTAQICNPRPRGCFLVRLPVSPPTGIRRHHRRLCRRGRRQPSAE